MVFYRKYRPQIISDLDNAVVREKLFAALSFAENVPHAFLFTGPKGLGKTSAARIVAKAVNCEGKGEPCNKCYQCVSITNGTNLDVLEIDGASNRGIDEIRDLREKIGLAPFGAKKKVYIIDEVHMLTAEAFNALLKTLEEPPSHALFILCTTELHKVPATIISRCFQIVFSRATAEELVCSFQRILQGEELKADEEVLFEIAKLSDGSFRDGTKILEELVSLSAGKKITKELVEQKFQISNIQFQISNILEILQKKDTKAGFALISKLVEQGVDMKFFLEQLINQLHMQLLAKIGIEQSGFTIYDLRFTIEETKILVELLTKAHQEIKYAVLPQLPLELAIVEWSIVDTRRSPHVASDARQAQDNNPSLPRSLSERRQQSLVDEEKDSIQSAFSSLASGQAPHILEKSKEKDLFQQFIEKVKAYNHSIAGVLRGCALLRYDDKELVIETRFKFHKEKLEEEKAREILEKVCKEILGSNISVSIVLKEK